MGDNGVIYSDYTNSTVLIRAGGSSPDGKIELKSEVLKDKIIKPQWQKQMEYFTEYLDEESDFSPSIDDGLRSLLIVLASYESSRSGKRIVL